MKLKCCEFCLLEKTKKKNFAALDFEINKGICVFVLKLTINIRLLYQPDG
jgi:hypothetical protein